MSKPKRKSSTSMKSAWSALDKVMHIIISIERHWCANSKLKASFRTTQTTTTCCFSSVTVTTGMIRSSKRKQPRTHSARDLKHSYQNQVSLQHPKFMSPLMSGHVSGLSSTKSVSLAKIRKHRFIHDALIAERNEFMSALRKVKNKQIRSETKAALMIQRLWRIYFKMIRKARELRRKTIFREENKISKGLLKILSDDSRCTEWAFSLSQRKQMDMQAHSSAEHAIQGTLRTRTQRLKTAHLRQERQLSIDSENSDPDNYLVQLSKSKSFPNKGSNQPQLGHSIDLKDIRRHSDDVSDGQHLSGRRVSIHDGLHHDSLHGHGSHHEDDHGRSLRTLSHGYGLIGPKTDVSLFKEVVHNSFEGHSHFKQNNDSHDHSHHLNTHHSHDHSHHLNAHHLHHSNHSPTHHHPGFQSQINVHTGNHHHHNYHDSTLHRRGGSILKKRSSLSSSSSSFSSSAAPSTNHEENNTSSFSSNSSFHSLANSKASKLRNKLAERVALKKLEESQEMIEARRLEAESRLRKPKMKLVLQTTGLFSKGLVLTQVEDSFQDEEDDD